MLHEVARLSCLIFMLLLLQGCSQPEESGSAANNAFDPSKSDAQAIAVIDEMMQALGGKESWENARYLSFRWLVGREGNDVADYRHDWDRQMNRYRVEGTNREGEHFVALFNTQTKEGEVYVNGEQVMADTTRSKMLDRAYGRFINDSYWLIMPYKLKDPGVVLTYEGEKQADGRTYDVVKVTFEGVGLTPGDTYWAYIDKQDRLMHKWEYVLQGWEEDQEATVAWWRDWQNFGGIKLAMSKEFEGRPTRIYFKDVTVSSEVADNIFERTTKTF